jgi:hypothetical protein
MPAASSFHMIETLGQDRTMLQVIRGCRAIALDLVPSKKPRYLRIVITVLASQVHQLCERREMPYLKKKALIKSGTLEEADKDLEAAQRRLEQPCLLTKAKT